MSLSLRGTHRKNKGLTEIVGRDALEHTGTVLLC